jgi:hypothetical protein
VNLVVCDVADSDEILVLVLWFLGLQRAVLGHAHLGLCGSLASLIFELTVRHCKVVVKWDEMRVEA